MFETGFADYNDEEGVCNHFRKVDYVLSISILCDASTYPRTVHEELRDVDDCTRGTT